LHPPDANKAFANIAFRGRATRPSWVYRKNHPGHHDGNDDRVDIERYSDDRVPGAAKASSSSYTLLGLGLATWMEFYTYDGVNLVLPDMAGTLGLLFAAVTIRLLIRHFPDVPRPTEIRATTVDKLGITLLASRSFLTSIRSQPRRDRRLRRV
jgi:hypothetical protein